MKQFISVVALLCAASTFAAGKLSGNVRIDGSSTVFPITEAVAEEFQKVHPQVKVTVGISGTGGGFKKFVRGDIDISDASRPIKATERDEAKKNGIEFLELPVAFDGLAIIVNPKNTWVTSITMEELKKIWEPGSKVSMWSDVRANWPKRKIKLYGPGTDSGTFDYFTEAVVGKEDASRPDFTASEDDNILVQGVAGDEDALGYFGYAYYVGNKDKLTLVPVDAGKGAIAPTDDTIRKGTYKLSRPLFIYVSKKALAKPETDELVKFYLTEAHRLVPTTGYLPLSKELYDLSMKRLKGRMLGTVFGGEGSKVNVTMETLLRKEGT